VSVTAPNGWLAAGVAAGTKPSGALDLALFLSERPASVAGAFTTNLVVGAPIVVSKPRVAAGHARGCVVSAGIANVATGEAGIEDAVEMARIAAEACGVAEEEMLVSATGIIGRRIPREVVEPAIKDAAAQLSSAGGSLAAEAILTTDARPKTATRAIDVEGVRVTIGGMAKGAGMIAPRMELHATMLVFLTTDGGASPEALQRVLADHLDRTFNSISVDGCTSTSDTVLLFANGAAGVDVDDDPAFAAAVGDLMEELALAIVRDGEGASKILRVRVSGAQEEAHARAAAREVATSLLVRCAVAGGDPNWGRIAQAIGQTSGLVLDPAAIDVRVAGVPVASRGAPTGREADAAAAMRATDEVSIEIELHVGSATWEFVSSDLTPEYVTFNAEYTT